MKFTYQNHQINGKIPLHASALTWFVQLVVAKGVSQHQLQPFLCPSTQQQQQWQQVPRLCHSSMSKMRNSWQIIRIIIAINYNIQS